MATLGASPFTISATGSYTIPQGVTSVQVECWGSGGAGQTGSAFDGKVGGGGGAYSIKAMIRVVPSKAYTFTIGAHGTLQDGGDTSFTGEDSTACIAKGGASGANGGAGGLASGSTGDIAYDGGSGGAGEVAGTGRGGGGGSSAYNAGNGLNGSAGAAGGAGGHGSGGWGGAGGHAWAQNYGQDGSVPGGGGGGGGGGLYNGGAGAAGQIIVTYIVNEATRNPGGGVSYIWS